MTNWTTMKRRILIGSLSNPTFVIRTAKKDRSRITFSDMLFHNISPQKHIVKYKSYFPSYLADDFSFAFMLCAMAPFFSALASEASGLGSSPIF